MDFYSSVQQLIRSMPVDNTFYMNQTILQSDRVAIFGAGSFGQDMAQNLLKANKKIEFFIDNDEKKHHNYICGIEVVSLDHILGMKKDDLLIIICSTWHNEIRQQLLHANVSNFIEADPVVISKYCYKYSAVREQFERFFTREQDKFDAVFHMLEDDSSKELFLHLIAYRVSGNIHCLKISDFKQYEHPIVRPEKRDVIIDGGGYIGDTAQQFNKLLDADCHIHSFEPSKDNFKKMKEWIENKGIQNVTTVQSGLGIENTELYMNSIEGEINPSNIIVEQGNEKVNIMAIDRYVEEYALQDVNLIKLDIEGFELSALQGADKTIQNFAPKIQVCLYHKIEDLIDIPLFFYNKYKDKHYKFYIGHHTDNYMETVLYAIRAKK